MNMFVVIASLLAMFTPETSKLFEKFVDPSSKVVSYLLKPNIKAYNQQSLYFTARSMTDDGRFLVFTISPDEFSSEFFGKKIPRTLAAVDFNKDEILEFALGNYTIPYVDTKNSAVYSADFKEWKLMRFDLASATMSAVCDLPRELKQLGRVKRFYTHLTISPDGQTAFFDTGIVPKGEKTENTYIQGTLNIKTGEWTKWGKTPFCCDHGQINPVNSKQALCAWEGVKFGKDGSYPRMWLLNADGGQVNIPSKAILHATHETWDDDGTGFYWCSRASDRGMYGVFRYNLADEQETCLAPTMAMHAMTTVDRRYVVYDWPLPPMGRGCAWRVGFYDRVTGGMTYIFSHRPAIADFANHQLSVLHPDPHPQFVLNEKYIVSTCNLEGRHMTLAVTPVAQLKLMTAAICGKVECTDSGIRLVKDGKIVWNLELNEEDGKPYVHPMTTPSGVVLTDIRPKDHVWHKGLWFSWKFINGVNYWETPDKCGPGGAGTTRLISKNVKIDGLGAKVNLDLEYSDKSGIVMSENRTMTFMPPNEVGGYAIMSEHKFTALADLKLDRTPPYVRADGSKAGGYAGFTLRLNNDAAERFSNRKDGKKWVEFENPESKESVLFFAREEPNTAKFYTWPDRRMSNMSVVYDSPLELKKGEQLRLIYVIQVKSPLE